MVQAHILPYVYWWPHILVWIGWCIGVLWVLLCLFAILIYGVNFDLLSDMDPTESITAAATSNETECAQSFDSYDVELSSQINYDLSNEYALSETGNDIEAAPEWGNVPDTVTWFSSFLMSFLISLIIFTPLTSYIIAVCQYYVYVYMWPAKPKYIFYNGIYENKSVLKDNLLNKFNNDDDLWNGIGLEIDEVAIAEHPYWVLNHPYVKEIRKRYFLTPFDPSVDINDDDNNNNNNNIMIMDNVDMNGITNVDAAPRRLRSRSPSVSGEGMNSDDNYNGDYGDIGINQESEGGGDESTIGAVTPGGNDNVDNDNSRSVKRHQNEKKHVTPNNAGKDKNEHDNVTDGYVNTRLGTGSSGEFKMTPDRKKLVIELEPIGNNNNKNNNNNRARGNNNSMFMYDKNSHPNTNYNQVSNHLDSDHETSQIDKNGRKKGVEKNNEKMKQGEQELDREESMQEIFDEIMGE